MSAHRPRGPGGAASAGDVLATFRPDRGHGMTVGVLATLWPLALGAGVLARASGGDATLGAFTLYLAGGALVVLSLAFAHWTFACATLSYELTAAALRIRWGWHQVVVPLAKIDVVAPAPAPAGVSGLNWPGHHIGRSEMEGRATVHVFATDFPGGQAVYVRAGTLILALTPHNGPAFVAAVESRRRGAPALAAEPRSNAFDASSLLADRASWAIAALALILNLAAFAAVFARYQDLPDPVAVDYPAGSEFAHLVARDDLFAMGLTGLALLALNGTLAVLLHRRQRALAQTILGGSVLLEGALLVATIAAVA